MARAKCQQRKSIEFESLTQTWLSRKIDGLMNKSVDFRYPMKPRLAMREEPKRTKLKINQTLILP